MTDVHTAAMTGFSAEAKAYARGRPGYPAELHTWLTTTLQLGPEKTVVDLGAGTGKFTALLKATKAKIIAVEPVKAMRAELTRTMPEIEAIYGTAQSLELETASTDVLVCAQSFHWFATLPALVEIHRVLKPQGLLGLVWNARDESVDWVAEITRILQPYEGTTPRFYKGDWRKAFDGTLFDALTETLFPSVHVGSPKEVIIDRFVSVSFIAALPAPEKAKVVAQLQALIDQHPALKGRSQIEFPYRTHAFSCSPRSR